MTRKITIAMQKGGVGKTATAVNLALGLAERGRRTLLVDLDHQGSASMALGIDKDSAPYTSESLILGTGAFDPVRLGDHLDVVPANQSLATVDLALIRDQLGGTQRLRRALAPVVGQYEYVVCDCAPTLGIVTLNAMLACPEILVPVQLARISVMGVLDLAGIVEAARQVETACHVAGYLPTFMHEQEREAREALALLTELAGPALLRTTIHRAASVAQAMGEGRSLLSGPDGRGFFLRPDAVTAAT